MDPLDKIEMIILGMRKETKKKLDRSNGNKSPNDDNPLYILGLQHDFDTLSLVWTKIDAVKRNHYSVRDEIVLRMYGS